MRPILKACLVCGAPFPGPGSRCPKHALPPRTRARVYRGTAHRIIAAATVCGICGQPLDANPNDPPCVDHIIPLAQGGTDDLTNLQAAHRSCNGRKSARLYRGEGQSS